MHSRVWGFAYSASFLATQRSERCRWCWPRKLLANWLRIKCHGSHLAASSSQFPAPWADFFSFFLEFCCAKFLLFLLLLLFGFVFVFVFACQKLIRLIKTLAGSAIRRELQVQSYFAQLIEWKLCHLTKSETNSWQSEREEMLSIGEQN